MPIAAKIETGNRISIWRTFVFSKRKYLYFSLELRHVDEISFADRLDLPKTVTSQTGKRM